MSDVETVALGRDRVEYGTIAVAPTTVSQVIDEDLVRAFGLRQVRGVMLWSRGNNYTVGAVRSSGDLRQPLTSLLQTVRIAKNLQENELRGILNSRL